DLDSIQAEITQRLNEIDRVSGQTQFNGVKVLAQDNTLTIQVGANDGETIDIDGTVAKLAMRQPFVLFKGLTFQKLCLPGAFRPGDHHNKMLRPG
ncbi:flagellin N-terminal helical domain-containing protein, partial [Salmonella enterica]